MKTTRRLAALVLASALLLAGCTGGGNPDGGGPDAGGATGPTGDDTGPTPAETFTGPPGTAVYGYANAGLEVTMDLDGNVGRMTVVNGTGRALPRPGFYILDARDGSRVDGEVQAAAPVPAGETATFEVSFQGIEIKNIGLILLLFGRDNYGAFVRTG